MPTIVKSDAFAEWIDKLRDRAGGAQVLRRLACQLAYKFDPSSNLHAGEHLQWQEIDFERACIRLPRHRSKTGEKTIPTNSRALAILERRRQLLAGRSASRFVFPSTRGDQPIVGMQKAWERIRRKAGLVDVRLHDLRHSFASFAAANGASPDYS